MWPLVNSAAPYGKACLLLHYDRFSFLLKPVEDDPEEDLAGENSRNSENINLQCLSLSTNNSCQNLAEQTNIEQNFNPCEVC